MRIREGQLKAMLQVGFGSLIRVECMCKAWLLDEVMNLGKKACVEIVVKIPRLLSVLKVFLHSPSV